MNYRNRLYEDIYHIYFTEKFNASNESMSQNIKPKKIIYIARFFLAIFFLSGGLVKSWFSRRKKMERKNRIWIYTHSKNNYDSLSFVSGFLDDTIFVSPSVQSYLSECYILFAKNRLKYHWRLPSFLYYLFKNKKKESIIKNLYIIFSNFGLLECYKRELKKYKPKVIFLANDHNATARALMLAANSLNIPTVYIQHASINDSFPPLKFDLSLLEGQDTLNKYKKIGNMQGKVQLIGMPKFDEFICCRNFQKNVKIIGISIGICDDLLKVTELIKKLKNYFPHIPICIRPHPAEGRCIEELKILADDYSDSKKEISFCFLQKIDVNIAANTSIHLESILLNVPSLFYPFEKNFIRHDSYNYIENGLIEEFKTAAQIIQWIEKYENNKPDVLQKAKYYNSTIGTEFDGKSSELAISYIKSFLKSKKTNISPNQQKSNL